MSLSLCFLSFLVCKVPVFLLICVFQHAFITYLFSLLNRRLNKQCLNTRDGQKDIIRQRLAYNLIFQLSQIGHCYFECIHLSQIQTFWSVQKINMQQYYNLPIDSEITLKKCPVFEKPEGCEFKSWLGESMRWGRFHNFF